MKNVNFSPENKIFERSGEKESEFMQIINHFFFSLIQISKNCWRFHRKRTILTNIRFMSHHNHSTQPNLIMIENKSEKQKKRKKSQRELKKKVSTTLIIIINVTTLNNTCETSSELNMGVFFLLLFLLSDSNRIFVFWLKI